jgi:hypothetical protein
VAYDLSFDVPGETALTKTRLNILPQGNTINILAVRKENNRPRRAEPLQP